MSKISTHDDGQMSVAVSIFQIGHPSWMDKFICTGTTDTMCLDMIKSNCDCWACHPTLSAITQMGDFPLDWPKPIPFLRKQTHRIVEVYPDGGIKLIKTLNRLRLFRSPQPLLLLLYGQGELISLWRVLLILSEQCPINQKGLRVVPDNDMVLIQMTPNWNRKRWWRPPSESK